MPLGYHATCAHTLQVRCVAHGRQRVVMFARSVPGRFFPMRCNLSHRFSATVRMRITCHSLFCMAPEANRIRYMYIMYVVSLRKFKRHLKTYDHASVWKIIIPSALYCWRNECTSSQRPMALYRYGRTSPSGRILTKREANWLSALRGKPQYVMAMIRQSKLPSCRRIQKRHDDPIDGFNTARVECKLSTYDNHCRGEAFLWLQLFVSTGNLVS